VNHFIEQPNRGKRSIGLDTSTPDGLELLMKLIETADVFLTNLLPDSRQRMGIDVEQVRARNPKIIYARGHGYGTKGDLASQGGFDLAAYWARGGIGDAYSDGKGSYPPIQRPAFGDSYGGLAIAGGIAAALVKRERSTRRSGSSAPTSSDQASPARTSRSSTSMRCQTRWRASTRPATTGSSHSCCCRPTGSGRTSVPGWVAPT
jgi:hypothetical protein